MVRSLPALLVEWAHFLPAMQEVRVQVQLRERVLIATRNLATSGYTFLLFTTSTTFDARYSPHICHRMLHITNRLLPFELRVDVQVGGILERAAAFWNFANDLIIFFTPPAPWFCDYRTEY